MGKVEDMKKNHRDNGSGEIPKVRFRGVLVQLLFEVVNDEGEPIHDMPTDPKIVLKGNMETPLKEYIDISVKETLAHLEMEEFKT